MTHVLQVPILQDQEVQWVFVASMTGDLFNGVLIQQIL